MTVDEFTRQLLKKCDSSYKDLLAGILEFYQLTGKLSDNQYKVVAVSASKAKLEIPAELRNNRTGLPTPPSSDDAIPAPQKPVQPDVATILGDVCRELATALYKASERLLWE